MTDENTGPSVGQEDHILALPAGTRVGKYELHGVLGQGGFGITYKGWDAGLRRSVAIKEYLPGDMAARVDGTTVQPRSRYDQESFQWGLERFLDEARALARFQGAPSIVRVHDFLEANGTAYLVMALVEGNSLSVTYREAAWRQQLDLPALLFRLLEGLEKVHSAGFLHRDIKPSNIILRPDGVPILIDFGAARQALGEKSRSITAVFTPGYAPFEQYMSAGYQGPWTDIYALAATFYQGITGAVPPAAPDRMRMDAMQPAAEAGAGRFSPEFLNGIDRGLEIAENRRPQSISEWREMLTTGRGISIPGAKSEGHRKPVVRPFSIYPAKRTWLAIVASAILAGIASGAYALWSDYNAGRSGTGLGAKRVSENAAQVAATPQDDVILMATEAHAEAVRRTEDEDRQRIEARRRAEREALLRAEFAARLAAEAEARQKAEVEAKRQSEAAERQREEAEVRARAETEARIRAELETQRKVEEEARRKAEEESRRKAEAEARKRAEDQGRQRAEPRAVQPSLQQAAEPEQLSPAEARVYVGRHWDAIRRSAERYLQVHLPTLSNDGLEQRLGRIEDYSVEQVNGSTIKLRLRLEIIRRISAGIDFTWGGQPVHMTFRNAPPDFPVLSF